MTAKTLEEEVSLACECYYREKRYITAFEIQCFKHGYIAAATLREKENKALLDSISVREAVMCELEAEIATLRAKLDAVPVEEVRAICEWELGLDFPDTAAISSWLATVTKPIPLPEGER